jgi:hypothetical protein
MKKLYFISIPVLIIFNIVNFYSVDLRFFGLFIIPSVFSAIGLVKYNYKKVIRLISLILLTDFIIRQITDQITSTNVALEDGSIVSVLIQFFAQVMHLGFSLVMVLIFNLIKHIFSKKESK